MHHSMAIGNCFLCLIVNIWRFFNRQIFSTAQKNTAKNKSETHRKASSYLFIYFGRFGPH